MKKVLNVIINITIWFVVILLVKLILNKFNFEMDLLIDSLFMTIGFACGWYGYAYFHKKWTKNK